MDNPKFNFEDLKVYQKVIEFVDYAYLPSKNWPDKEKCSLTSQFRRAAISIALNIG